jgi:hypothetical protein
MRKRAGRAKFGRGSHAAECRGIQKRGSTHERGLPAAWTRNMQIQRKRVRFMFRTEAQTRKRAQKSLTPRRGTFKIEKFEIQKVVAKKNKGRGRKGDRMSCSEKSKGKSVGRGLKLNRRNGYGGGGSARVGKGSGRLDAMTAAGFEFQSSSRAVLFGRLRETPGWDSRDQGPQDCMNSIANARRHPDGTPTASDSLSINSCIKFFSFDMTTCVQSAPMNHLAQYPRLYCTVPSPLCRACSRRCSALGWSHIPRPEVSSHQHCASVTTNIYFC